jgi:hypothetical protein
MHLMPASRPLKDRFWEKVSKDGPRHKSLGKCWVWTAAKEGTGYGSIGLGPGNGLGKAHRVSWELHYGTIPYGLCVLHKCDNPACVRPSHLFLGTQLDNARDKEGKGRGNHARGDAHPARRDPSYLKRGDEHHMRRRPDLRYYGSKNCKAVLSESDVVQIRSEFDPATMEYADLSSKYGVSPSTIGRIIRRETWIHIE